MTLPSANEPILAAKVRAVLVSTEPDAQPAFSHVWAKAERAAGAVGRTPRVSSRALWRPALAMSIVVGVAIFAASYLKQQRLETARTQADDYQLALRVASAYASSVPTDSLLQSEPRSLLRGGPELSTIQYPLMPKEAFL